MPQNIINSLFLLRSMWLPAWFHLPSPACQPAILVAWPWRRQYPSLSLCHWQSYTIVDVVCLLLSIIHCCRSSERLIAYIFIWNRVISWFFTSLTLAAFSVCGFGAADSSVSMSWFCQWEKKDRNKNNKTMKMKKNYIWIKRKTHTKWNRQRISIFPPIAFNGTQIYSVSLNTHTQFVAKDSTRYVY